MGCAFLSVDPTSAVALGISGCHVRMSLAHSVGCADSDCCVACLAGAGFLPWMPSFTRWFNGLKPITLTASVIFFPPFIRDIACWAGFRQVRG